jgi:hypothetical protein
LLDPVDEMSVRLIERADATITPEKGDVCLDLDRLPSGMFDTNDAILRLGMPVHNRAGGAGWVSSGRSAILRRFVILPSADACVTCCRKSCIAPRTSSIRRGSGGWIWDRSPVAKAFAHLQQRLVVAPRVASG